MDVHDKWGEKMSRYIDIETINPRTYESSEVELGVLAYDYDEIEAMPFLDIVRCKECKHNVGLSNGDGFWEEDIVCDFWESDGLHADDYCSYGEREEEE